MKAYYIGVEGAKTRLEPREVPQPVAGPGQVLVKVKAASLNRGEFIVGGLTKAGEAKPAGNEVAGDVVGTNQRVMGRCAGAYAEYALMDAREAIPELTAADIRVLVAMMRWLGERTRLGPTAVLVETDFQFGITRMVEMMIEDVCQVKPFRSESDARRWLGW